MKKLQFKITIDAPVAQVYDRMLGLTDKSTYEAWTAAFNPTSSYEGNWEKGSKIHFVGVDENGQKGGMVSRIADHIPHRFVSIQHIGLLQGGQEVLDGPDVEKWANGFENYTYEENNGSTTVTVDLDAIDEFAGYFEETYPQALEKLKNNF